MDSEDYKKGCLQILSDKEFYEELPENPNITYKKEIDAKVDTLLSNDIITEFEASKLTLETRTPCFYGLPKIHKLFDHFPPLRPICSGYYSCIAKISEFVDAFLKPAAQHSSSYVRDTLDFIRKLDNGHHSDAKIKPTACELAHHFHHNTCDFNKELRVYILQDNVTGPKYQ